MAVSPMLLLMLLLPWVLTAVQVVLALAGATAPGEGEESRTVRLGGIPSSGGQGHGCSRTGGRRSYRRFGASSGGLRPRVVAVEDCGGSRRLLLRKNQDPGAPGSTARIASMVSERARKMGSVTWRSQVGIPRGGTSSLSSGASRPGGGRQREGRSRRRPAGPCLWRWPQRQ